MDDAGWQCFLNHVTDFPYAYVNLSTTHVICHPTCKPGTVCLFERLFVLSCLYKACVNKSIVAYLIWQLSHCSFIKCIIHKQQIINAQWCVYNWLWLHNRVPFIFVHMVWWPKTQICDAAYGMSGNDAMPRDLMMMVIFFWSACH